MKNIFKICAVTAGITLPLSLFAAQVALPSWQDVDFGAWYGDAVREIYYLGWMKGYGDERASNAQYGVGDAVSREELAVILSRMNSTINSTLTPLKTIVCSNKENFLANVTLREGQGVSEENYKSAIERLCQETNCSFKIDLQTGNDTEDRFPCS